MGLTKEELDELRQFKKTSEDENIRFKTIIKNKLSKNKKILYALNNPDLDIEEPDTYFGDTGNIRDYVFFPEVQDKGKNFICFKCDWNNRPNSNNFEKLQQIIFLVLCDTNELTDRLTGIPRHDLISALIIEEFANTNIFGNFCRIVSNKESVTDSKYVTRTITFEMTTTNSITKKGKGVNHLVIR